MTTKKKTDVTAAAGKANNITIEKAVAGIPGTRANSPLRKAVLAYFATGQTDDATAKSAGLTVPRLKTYLSQAFAGSMFGKGFDAVK